MKTRVLQLILLLLVTASILVQVLEAPAIYRLLVPVVTLFYFMEVFIRRRTRQIFGKSNKHLGGGYHSGGRLPGWAPNGDGKGSGGVNADGVKVAGAGTFTGGSGTGR